MNKAIIYKFTKQKTFIFRQLNSLNKNFMIKKT